MPIKEELDNTAGRKHPVPQNVMDVEFKVVWDLTVRQLGYLFGGGMLVFLFQMSGLPPFWKWILMVSSGLLAIAVAFVPVQERGLDRWIVNFIKAMIEPAQKVWRKSYSPPAYFVSDYANIIRKELVALTPAKSRSQLEEYLDALPKNMSVFERKELERLSNIQKIYEQSLADTQIITRLKRQVSTPTLKEIQKSELNSKNEFAKANAEQKTITAGPIDRPLVNLPQSLKGEIQIKTKSKLPSNIPTENLKNVENREKQLKKDVEELLALTKKARAQLGKETDGSKNKIDKLKLFRRKHEELKKERLSIAKKLQENKPKDEKEKRKYEDIIKRLEKENKELERSLAQVKKEMEALKGPIKNPESRKNAQQKVTIPTDQTAPVKHTNTKTSDVQAEIKLNAKVQTNVDVNVIHGIVKDPEGQLLENALVIIKDEDGDVVRALQSNKLGTFATQTPLPKGKYTVEIVKGKFKFDIISVNVNDKVLPPVYIVAKS